VYNKKFENSWWLKERFFGFALVDAVLVGMLMFFLVLKKYDVI